MFAQNHEDPNNKTQQETKYFHVSNVVNNMNNMFIDCVPTILFCGMLNVVCNREIY